MLDVDAVKFSQIDGRTEVEEEMGSPTVGRTRRRKSPAQYGRRLALLDHMRIEFQYNLDEWLEWKRSKLPMLRLIPLRMAEASLMPLYLLCALSIVLALLRYLDVAQFVVANLPAWTPIVFLVLLAIAHIFLSTIPHLRKTTIRQDWKQRVTQMNYILEITEDGITSNPTDPNWRTDWSEYSHVFQTKRLLLFCEGDGPELLIIPKRAFGSKEELNEFLRLAYRKTVLERNGAESSKKDGLLPDEAKSQR